MSSRRTTDDTVRLVIVIVAALVLAPVAMMVLAVPMMGTWGGGMMGYGGGMYGGTGVWGLGMTLVWLLVLVGGGYLAYRWLRRAGDDGTDRAVEELRLAYARGDLTDEEFEARREALERE